MTSNIHAAPALRTHRLAGTRESSWRSRRQLPIVAFGVAVTIVAAACGSDASVADTSAQSSSGSSVDNELYQANCASCHGADLRGTDKGPSHLSIVYEPNHHNDDSFRSAIVNGARQHHWNFGDMAAIPGLDDDEIDDIIAFIRSEQQRQGFEQ